MSTLSLKHLTFRGRLAVAFGAMAFGAGALVILMLYLFMRFVPTYLVSEAAPGDTAISGVTSTSAETATPDGFNPVGIGGKGFAVITDVAGLLETMLWAGVGILLLIALSAATVGWFISGRVLKPLQRIRDAARRAGEGTLDHRIALEGPHDELRDLAETFDTTLDRLESAFTAHQRFAANAAHELRTPLTATKTLIDINDAHPAASDPADLLNQIRINNDRSIGIVQALLDLTDLETTQINGSPIDLATIVTSITSEAGRGAEAVQRIGPAPATGDETLLRVLIENVMQNAERHNDERREILIATGTTGRFAWVRIENTGPVIPNDLVDKLAEPLYRGTRAARDGYGLGLSIATRIAEAHRGALTMTSRVGGGLTVELHLPGRGSVSSID
ncbi:sensor histidine kinase [Microbacterium sp. GXS0129]|uniref:sensor histidine kinase n=1 Tax=Microbacterium sp. GXS0129 TaxID=3377836 RepID=UPI00383B4A58